MPTTACSIKVMRKVLGCEFYQNETVSCRPTYMSIWFRTFQIESRLIIYVRTKASTDDDMVVYGEVSMYWEMSRWDDRASSLSLVSPVYWFSTLQSLQKSTSAESAECKCGSSDRSGTKQIVPGNRKCYDKKRRLGSSRRSEEMCATRWHAIWVVPRPKLPDAISYPLVLQRWSLQEPGDLHLDIKQGKNEISKALVQEKINARIDYILALKFPWMNTHSSVSLFVCHVAIYARHPKTI